MHAMATMPQLLLTFVLMLSAVGVLFFKNPVHASLSFLLTLLTLAALYLELAAPFIAVIQVLVYAGAILVIFMFVIILFQDAHSSIANHPAKHRQFFFYALAAGFGLVLLVASRPFLDMPTVAAESSIGSVVSIGQTLFTDFFFPFEATFLLFIVALVGALYIGKKEET